MATAGAPKPKKAKIDPAVKAAVLAEKIKNEVVKNAGKGLRAAMWFLVARVKETMSVPAPRRTVKRPDGSRYYVATTPAEVGAPIRKLSGQARQRLTGQMQSPTKAVVGCAARAEPTKAHPQGFNYPRYHELVDPARAGSGRHSFVRPTVSQYKKELAAIIGKDVKGGL